MVLTLCAAVIALTASSMVLGWALESLGLRCRAAAPAVGLAGMIIIASIAIKLPGRTATAAVVLCVIELLAAGRLVTRRRQARVVPVAMLLTVLITGFGAALPFLAAGRLGVLGVSLDNDTANHLSWAEALQSQASAARYPPQSGYPLGPHSLMDVVANGLGLRLDDALVAVLISAVLVTALTATSALRRGSLGRPFIGAMGALLYLSAAYYGESAFKEILLGMMLLGVVMQLEDLVKDADASPRERCLGVLPLAILCAGALYVYSYPALVWMVPTLVIWSALELVSKPGWRQNAKATVRLCAAPIGVGVAAVVILLLPIASAIVSFANLVGASPAATGAIGVSNRGNLAGPLSPYEALGVWDSPDFRFAPSHAFLAGEVGALALAVFILGLIWSLRRRSFALPAAAATCVIVYWEATRGQSVYVSAKALVVAAPVVGVTIGRALFAQPVLPLSAWARATRLAVALAFTVLAANSTVEVLRASPVWATESTNELVRLARLTQGQALLFLGDTDYAPWIFHASKMSTLDASSASLGQAQPRSGKPPASGTAFDVDSVDPSAINRFAYMITTTTSYASQVPAAFRLVKRLAMYELWRRTRFVEPRYVIEAPGQPGAVLSCRNPGEHGLSKRRGIAATMRPPVVAALPAITPGHSAGTQIKLGRGRWSLSLSYLSQEPLIVTAGGERWRLPAYNDRIGPYFAIGSIESTGRPLVVTIKETRPSIFTGPTPTQIAGLAAMPEPDPRVLVPLSRACGDYVDWFRFR